MESNTTAQLSDRRRHFFLKLIGIVFILCAILIALLIEHPSKAQYFILYTLIGVGIALLLSKSAQQSAASFKVWNTSITLAGGVALPFILFFTNPIGAIKSDVADEKKTSVTVYVHGKASRQDMILRQQGHVIMDVTGGERKRADINENGAAFFQNLMIGERVQLAVDFSEPYTSLYPDSIYTITSEGSIYLQVALRGIDLVQGRVLYNDDPLKNVIVEVDNLKDTTDQSGRFSISIPEAQQKKDYKVWFIKSGFKTRSAPAFPQTGQPLEIVLEKSSS